MITNKLNDVNISSIKQLISPESLATDLPLSPEAYDTVAKTRHQVQEILEGKDDRLIVVVGPCSIHNSRAAMEYARLLKQAQGQLSHELLLIMRVYFEKPRTSLGWKGLINDPFLDGTFDINRGLRIARELLLDLNSIGIPAGTEFLDTIIPQYISELISWGAIGARTTESQIHRELASGLSMPIAFKNGTDGNIDIAIDAMRAARFVHHFVGVTREGLAAILATKGNKHCHVILRGAKSHTNYDKKHIDETAEKLKKYDFSGHLMVDCSHANSQKNHINQLGVVSEVSQMVADGARTIMGIMIESHLNEGKQPFTIGEKPLYNISITDPCLSWKDTEKALQALAWAVKSRRRSNA